jgi:hypothetical protein
MNMLKSLQAGLVIAAAGMGAVVLLCGSGGEVSASPSLPQDFLVLHRAADVAGGERATAAEADVDTLIEWDFTRVRPRIRCQSRRI